MAIFGYGRVSTNLQTTENQKLLIETKLGVKLDFWYEDSAVSGTTKANIRPMFAKMLQNIQKGDRVVFTRVDRVSRKASDALQTIENLLEKGVDVYILQIGKESLSSPMGKVALGMFSIFAEFERDSIVERVNSGLERTKKQGTVLGSQSALAPAQLRSMIKEASTMSQGALAKRYNVGISTVKRHISKYSTEEACNDYETLYNKRQQQHNKEN